jgi:hypothetical protein
MLSPPFVAGFSRRKYAGDPYGLITKSYPETKNYIRA